MKFDGMPVEVHREIDTKPYTCPFQNSNGDTLIIAIDPSTKTGRLYSNAHGWKPAEVSSTGVETDHFFSLDEALWIDACWRACCGESLQVNTIVSAAETIRSGMQKASANAIAAADDSEWEQIPRESKIDMLTEAVKFFAISQQALAQERLVGADAALEHKLRSTCLVWQKRLLYASIECAPLLTKDPEALKVEATPASASEKGVRDNEI